jgi:arylsulfatase
MIGLFPTLCAAAGVKPTKPVEGFDLLQPPPRSRKLYWEHEGDQAIREHGSPWELFNIARDRTELYNLIATEPECAAAPALDWQRWAGSVGVLPWKSWEKK